MLYKAHLKLDFILSKVHFPDPHVCFIPSAFEMGFTILHRCLILEIVGCVIMMCLSSFQKKLCAFQWQGYDYDWQPISMLLHYQLSLCFGVTFVQHLSLTVLCCYFRAPFVPNLYYPLAFFFVLPICSILQHTHIEFKHRILIYTADRFPIIENMRKIMFCRFLFSNLIYISKH